MAEGLFRAMNGQVRTGLQAQSAGLFAHEGLPASENAILAASEYGADLTVHHARQLDEQIVREALYLVCMTAAHYDRLVERNFRGQRIRSLRLQRGTWQTHLGARWKPIEPVPHSSRTMWRR